MFDKLNAVLDRFRELNEAISQPEIIQDIGACHRKSHPEFEIGSIGTYLHILGDRHIGICQFEFIEPGFIEI